MYHIFIRHYAVFDLMGKNAAMTDTAPRKPLSAAFYGYFWQAVLARQQRGSLNKEDALRYAFFHSLTACAGIDQADIHLESHHMHLEGNKEIDLLVPPTSEHCGLIVEFKFHRQLVRKEGQRQHNHARTTHAASLSKDLHRIGAYEPGSNWQRLLVYVTDDEMAGYLHRNELYSPLYNGLNPVAVQALIEGNPSKSYQKVVEGLKTDVVAALVSRLDEGSLHLRVFEVSPAPASL